MSQFDDVVIMLMCSAGSFNVSFFHFVLLSFVPHIKRVEGRMQSVTVLKCMSTLNTNNLCSHVLKKPECNSKSRGHA